MRSLVHAIFQFLSLLLQQGQLGDVRILDTAQEVLGSYNAFWLRLGLEVVVGCAVSGGRGPGGQAADLSRFVRERFLNDPELAYEGATNKAIDGLYTDQYWVSPFDNCWTKWFRDVRYCGEWQEMSRGKDSDPGCP